MKSTMLGLGGALLLIGCGQSAAPGGPGQHVATKPPAAAVLTPAPAPAPAVACAIKVQTINICTDGDCYSIGLQTFSVGAGGAALTHVGGGPKELWLFRSFSNGEKADAQKKGLATGKAYFRLPDKSYQYLCDVDTQLSDDELWARLGHIEKR